MLRPAWLRRGSRVIAKLSGEIQGHYEVKGRERKYEMSSLRREDPVTGILATTFSRSTENS
jgi:hypothetical protein